MMLKFQSDNNLINLKSMPLKLPSLVLLFFALNSAPTFATENLKIGTVFDRNKAGLDFYYKGIDSARGAHSNITIERGDYSSTCDDAVQKTEHLITEKLVQVILSVEKNGCSSEIGKVANQFSVLHISLIFTPTRLLPSSELWLRVESYGSPPKPAYIVLETIEKPLSSDQEDKNLIFKVKQLYAVFREVTMYKVRVPFAPLREKPARPGENPDKSEENKIKAKLKKGDLLLGKAVITDHSNLIENYCKRKMKEGLIYDYIYTVDWICVRVKSSHDPSYKGKTGWIHRLLVE
jgi:hypothetical protein